MLSKDAKNMLLIMMIITLLAMAGCASTKKDCSGHKKYKQENGIWF